MVKICYGYMRLSRGGIDTVKGLFKNVDVFDKCISGGKAGLIFENAHCKERTGNICVFRGGLNFLQICVGYCY